MRTRVAGTAKLKQLTTDYEVLISFDYARNRWRIRSAIDGEVLGENEQLGRAVEAAWGRFGEGDTHA